MFFVLIIVKFGFPRNRPQDPEPVKTGPAPQQWVRPRPIDISVPSMMIKISNHGKISAKMTYFNSQRKVHQSKFNILFQ